MKMNKLKELIKKASMTVKKRSKETIIALIAIITLITTITSATSTSAYLTDRNVVGVFYSDRPSPVASYAYVSPAIVGGSYSYAHITNARPTMVDAYPRTFYPYVYRSYPGIRTSMYYRTTNSYQYEYRPLTLANW